MVAPVLHLVVTFCTSVDDGTTTAHWFFGVELLGMQAVFGIQLVVAMPFAGAVPQVDELCAQDISTLETVPCKVLVVDCRVLVLANNGLVLAINGLVLAINGLVLAINGLVLTCKVLVCVCNCEVRLCN